MRIISTTFADLEHSDLGTKSRLASEINGVPILRRTVERITGVRGMAQHIVLCPPAQMQRVQRILHGLEVEIVAIDGEPDPWRALTRAARKWSIDGWRGGLGGTSYFDEFCFPSLLHCILAKHPADAVFAYPPAAPLISGALTQRMLEQREKLGDQTRIVFSQAVPGLAGILLDAVFIAELAQAKSPVGSVFSYKPDWPRKDLIFHPACLELPIELRYATGRLVADTDRSLERVHALLRDIGDGADEAIGRWLIERDNAHVESFPREVEIELTTDTPSPKSLLRPAAGLDRGPIDLRTVETLAAEVCAKDDTLVVLGGFGDPLRHPESARVLELLTQTKRPYGLAVRTFAADLDKRSIESFLGCKVDVCCLMLDAWSSELYRKLHSPEDVGGGDHQMTHGPMSTQKVSTLTPAPLRGRERGGLADLDSVLERISRLDEARQAARSVVPIVVPEFCKAKENVHEMDAFYDGWLRRTGTVSVVGPSNRAGEVPDRSVVNMQPPVRSACRRIRARCVVLANGMVTACDQDQEGRLALGSLRERSLSEIWLSAVYRALRAVHEANRWAEHPLCSKCTDWHRP